MQRLACYSLTFSLTFLFGCISFNQGSQTVTPLNSATVPTTQATSTRTPKIVSIVSPHPSSTLLPTLEPETAKIAIKEMLNQERQCVKPCLFGIVPDQTTLEEAQNFYEYLNMNFRLTYQEGEKQYYSTGYGFDDDWGFMVTHIVENSVVRNTTLGISFVNYTGSTPQAEWSAFRPNAILQIYGQPSDVKLSLSFPRESGFPSGTAWYDIVMHFPDSDLIVMYDYELTNAGENVTACPLTDKSLGVGVWLGKEPYNPPGGTTSLAEATKLSLEEFYSLLTQNSSSVCFSLNPKAFFPKQ